MHIAHLSCLRQWLRSEDQVAAFAQVIIVHAFSDLGNGIIARQALQKGHSETNGMFKLTLNQHAFIYVDTAVMAVLVNAAHIAS